jgi:hypothetical protein
MDPINQEIGVAFQATQLILVFLTVLFSLGYPKIQKLLHREKPNGKTAKKDLVIELVETFHHNMPLLLISMSMFWLFFPLFWKVVLNSRLEIWNFDFARTSFIFISLMIFFFSGWSIILMIKIVNRIKYISEKDWKWALIKLIDKNDGISKSKIYSSIIKIINKIR